MRDRTCFARTESGASGPTRRASLNLKLTPGVGASVCGEGTYGRLMIEYFDFEVAGIADLWLTEGCAGEDGEPTANVRLVLPVATGAGCTDTGTTHFRMGAGAVSMIE